MALSGVASKAAGRGPTPTSLLVAPRRRRAGRVDALPQLLHQRLGVFEMDKHCRQRGGGEALQLGILTLADLPEQQRRRLLMVDNLALYERKVERSPAHLVEFRRHRLVLGV